MSGKAILKINNMTGLVQRNGLYGYQPLVDGKPHLQAFFCKDYMNDLLYASYHNKTVMIYGYKATPTNIFSKKNFQFIFFSVKDFSEIEKAYKFTQKLIEFMKEKIQIEIIDIRRANDVLDKGILVTLPIKICKDTIKLSLFLEAIRLFEYTRGEDIKTFLLTTKKENFFPINSTERPNKLFEKYLEKFNPNVFEVRQDFKVDSYYNNKVHNYFGFISHILTNT